MCLGVPGEVVEIREDPVGMTMGRVSFGGIVKDVCLAYTPDVDVGEYVVVHVGFAISKIDEESARQVFRYLREMDELDDLGDSNDPAPRSAPEVASRSGRSGKPPDDEGAGERNVGPDVDAEPSRGR